MKASRALAEGWRTLARAWRMCVVFYAAVTVAALLAMLPLMFVAVDSLGSSAWAAELTANLNFQWIGEMLSGKHGLALEESIPVLAGVFAVILLVDLFLLGGALSLFAAGEAFSMRAFFAGCGRNFARLVRLGVVSLVFYGAAAAVWVGISSIGDAIWGEGSRATPLVHWDWFSAVVGLCLLGLVNLWFDYARIFLIASEAPRVWAAIQEARRFILANLGPAIRLYAGIWCIGGAGLAVYLALAWILAAPTPLAILLLFLVRQCAVLAKSAFRLLFYSSFQKSVSLNCAIF